MAQLTPEQLEILVAMQDIGGMEDEQTRLQHLAGSLRGKDIRGSDWGSNLGRAGYGVGAAVGDYKAAQQEPKISGARKSTVAELLRGMKKGSGEQLLPPSVDEYGQPIY